MESWPGRLVAFAPGVIAASAVVWLFSAVSASIVTPTTAPTTTRAGHRGADDADIVIATVGHDIDDFDVDDDHHTGHRPATTPTNPPIPTIPPVIVSSTPTTHGDPPATSNPANVAISTTSAVLDVAVEPGEIVPDVYVRGVEITQGIQDLRSRMPLVADRKTTVRVHIGVDPGFAYVDGALLIERPDQADVVLHPDNGPVAPGLDRTDIDSALNFELDPSHYAAGEATFTAQVWSAGFTSIADEPNTQNNLLTEHVEFHVADVPTVWLMALDDGSGPGDQVDDVTGLLGFAPVAFDDLIDFLPIASVDFQAYPLPVGPGAGSRGAGAVGRQPRRRRRSHGERASQRAEHPDERDRDRGRLPRRRPRARRVRQLRPAG